MSYDPRKPPRPSHPTSMPPEVPVELDSSWDDDTVPRLELDDPMSESAFDRVTAIPELPSELFAKQVMEQEVDESVTPTAPSLPDSHEVPRLASEPPVVSVRPLDPMGMREPPRAGRALSMGDIPATGQHAISSPTAATARPGRNRPNIESEPTGLELSDSSASPVTARSPEGSSFTRDPRDPVLDLDLDLGDVAGAGPPPAPPPDARDAELTEMKDRYAMGDFTGALVVAEGLLEIDADDLDAQRCAQRCRDVLTQMYSARLGPLGRRVEVAVPSDQIRWLSLDHRAGFVLSLIDGSSTVEEVLDVSGMNRLDALRILFTLYDQRVIHLSER